MNDLRNPDKHLEIAQHCNFWWLVVGDPKIIKDGELPESWGFMVPRGKNLMIRKQAPFREIDHFPTPFVASLLRSALRASPVEHEIETAVARAVEKERNYQREHGSYEIKRTASERDGHKETLERFEEASGVKVAGYNSGEIGDAVKFVLNGGMGGLRDKFNAIKKQADAISFMAENASLHTTKGT